MKFPTFHRIQCSCSDVTVDARRNVDPVCREYNATRTQENKAFVGHREAIRSLERANGRLRRNRDQKIEESTELKKIIEDLPGGMVALAEWLEAKRDARRAAMGLSR